MAALSSITLRVRYAETDQMGVVYHANYFVWFEMGRVELLRDLGFSYKQMEEDDCHLPVVEAACRYSRPARYDDLLLVQTRIVLLRSSLIKFTYLLSRPATEPLPVSDSAGDLLAEAETTHLLVDGVMKKRRFPEKYAAVLAAAVLP